MVACTLGFVQKQLHILASRIQAIFGPDGSGFRSIRSTKPDPNPGANSANLFFRKPLVADTI